VVAFSIMASVSGTCMVENAGKRHGEVRKATIWRRTRRRNPIYECSTLNERLLCYFCLLLG